MLSLSRLVPRLSNLGSRAQCSRKLSTSIIRPSAMGAGNAEPISNERAFDWPESVKNFLEKEKITQPTLIQEKTLPLAMENKDIVGIARTGSGKTLAFVIPAVMKILQENTKKPTCLVLAPTRELATQTAEVFKKFSHLGIESIVLVGGGSRNEQMRQLRHNSQNVYIATPGRLLDLMESGLVSLSDIKYLVFDEADRMLDMGFEPQIRRIVEQIPKDRQTLMWSATWPSEIQALARDFMVDYQQVKIDSEKLKANPNIKQIVEICDPYKKLDKLLEYFKKFEQDSEQPRTLIFVNTKRMADQLLMQLMRNRYRAICMHGDRSQSQRDQALKLFKNKHCNIMVATDVAARGLDISDITHVVNYDFPTSIEDYIHRIGRTARHEKKGTAVTLLTYNDAIRVPALIRILKETSQDVPAELEELAASRHLYESPKPNKQRGRKDDFYSRGSRNDTYSRGGKDVPYSRGEGPERRNSRLNIFDDL